jgi:hypothetical protein
LVAGRPARPGVGALLLFFSTLPQTIVCSLGQNRIECRYKLSAVSFQPKTKADG